MSPEAPVMPRMSGRAEGVEGKGLGVLGEGEGMGKPRSKGHKDDGLTSALRRRTKEF